MKKTATILWALLLSLFVSLPLYAEGILAFPGAEGFGRFVYRWTPGWHYLSRNEFER